MSDQIVGLFLPRDLAVIVGSYHIRYAVVIADAPTFSDEQYTLDTQVFDFDRGVWTRRLPPSQHGDSTTVGDRVYVIWGGDGIPGQSWRPGMSDWENLPPMQRPRADPCVIGWRDKLLAFCGIPEAD